MEKRRAGVILDQSREPQVELTKPHWVLNFARLGCASSSPAQLARPAESTCLHIGGDVF